jgi:RNA polymerase sigma-70 factor (ECF subfamily)
MDMALSQLTDEELVERAKSSDLLAFSEIVSRYQGKLLRYGRRFLRQSEDVEDAVQEAFLQAYRNIAGFRSGQRLSPWMYRIAHNAFIDLIRSKKREPVPFFDADTLFPHPVAPDRTEDRAEQLLIRRQLEQGLDQLSLQYREPLVLRYFEDLSYKEISDILHLPLGTVSIRIKRGLEKLQNYISHD